MAVGEPARRGSRVVLGRSQNNVDDREGFSLAGLTSAVARFCWLPPAGVDRAWFILNIGKEERVWE